MNARLRLGLLLIILSLFATGSRSGMLISPQRILDLVNQDRVRHGLSELVLNPKLNLAAMAKAEDMLANGYFAHESPVGTKPWHWLKSLGYNYSYAGENLAQGFSDAMELENSWMSSPTHRANILSPFYSEVGLAVVGSGSSNLVVQFLGSEDSKLTLRK